MKPLRCEHIEVAGRRVGWREWGEASGRPVLYCTGAGMSSSLGFGHDAIRELGVRLISVDRAGLGLSEPDPDKSLDSYAADVAEVLAALTITRPRVVAFSQGAPFAVTLAGRGVTGPLAIVSGQDELAHPEVRGALPAQVAGMIAAIAADPAAFEADFAARVDPDGLYELVVALSAPVDRTLYESPAFAPAYRRCLQEGFARGPGGYVRDVVLAMSPWPVPPEQVQVPVRLWYGALDTSPVHSPDLGERLATRFPHATRRVLDGEGGSVLWTRSRAILDDLLRCA